MNSMNYIGKFISNFRDFYNEINTATLTGAIDVVVVEQADGTFNCSPFHVRFGKLGVLRSREKVVDIEVNGEPLDIHMKLGESGEAFFVEEVACGELGDDEFIPPHLATSPIPSETFLSRYHEDKERQLLSIASIDDEWLANKHRNGFNIESLTDRDLNEMHRPSWPDAGTSQFKGEKVSSTQEISLLVSGADTKDSDLDDHDHITGTPKMFRAETMEGKVSEKVRRISIVTGEFRPIVMDPQDVQVKVDELPSENIGSEVLRLVSSNNNAGDIEVLIDTPVSQGVDDSSKAVNSTGKRKRRKKSFMKKKGGMKKNSGSSSSQTEQSEMSEAGGKEPVILAKALAAESNVVPIVVKDPVVPDSLDQSAENIFEIEDIIGDSSEYTKTAVQTNSHSSNKLAKLPASPPMSISLPALISMAENSDSTSLELATMKHASTETNFHFFSDTEVTPGTSPLDSRPNSPIQSDTEVDRLRHSETISTEYASGNKDCGEVAQSWRWGELPSPPPRIQVANRQTSTTTLIKDVASGGDDDAKQIQEAAAAEAAQRSIISGMFSFMKKTKRLRHNPEGEGIYLADINADELDPEVAALYFPASYRQGMNIQQVGVSRDEDAESGNGTSLPQSPHSVDGAIGGPKSLDSDFEEPKHSIFQDKSYNEISMSLCGGLNETGPNDEAFVQGLVTYDDLVANPKLIENPDLVVRLDGKYYNWKTACPMVMSVVLYQRALPQHVVDLMTAAYMPHPPKEAVAAPKDGGPRTGYTSWFSWRKSTEPKMLEGGKGELVGGEVDPATTTESFEEDGEEEAGQGDRKKQVMESNGTTPLNVIVNKVTEVVDEEAPIVDTEATFPATPIQSEAIPVPKDVKEEGYNGSNSSDDSDTGVVKHSTKLPRERRSYYENTDKFRKTLRLSSEQIASLDLLEGANEVVFSVTTAYQGTTRCKCHIYKWRYDDRVVISDIDGTITKSDVLGHILPIVGKDWAQSGVAQLFTKIKNNGYKLLYLSARAIGQARVTREYLRSIKQGDLSLPDGPLLLNPTSLISAFHREVIEKKPEEFKISCLRDILALFPAGSKPFYAGYGNKVNDVWAYRAVGIPIFRIFTINHRGELKHELTQTFQSSYSNMSYIVDQMFPPPPEVDASEDYSSFVYWREPIADISIKPPIEAIASKAASKVPNSKKESPKKTP